MNKKSNRIASVVLASSLVFGASCVPTKAIGMEYVLMAMIQLVGPMAQSLLNFLLSSACDKANNFADEKDRDLNGGFRPIKTIIRKLKKIINDNIKRPVYGQEKAKKQLFDVLSNIAVKVHKAASGKVSHRDLTGNIVYIRGNSGTGKTEMCREIANAFLNVSSCSSLFVHSEEITQDAELGTQLFKLISTADIGKKRPINYFTGNNGIVPKNEESPMLKHILKWVDNVVIIDEYDKMKQKTSKAATSAVTINGISVPKTALGQATTSGGASTNNDTSADEVFRSIASTGKYKFMNKEVDCSRTLFLITTNETREQIEQNFGVGGQAGGGAQRLNIIDFEDLTYDACTKIVDDLTVSINKELTDKDEPYGLSELIIAPESKKLMSDYIFDDKILQGRAKFALERKIYGLFSKTIGLDTGNSYELTFVYDKENHDGHFERKNTTDEYCDKITNEIIRNITSELSNPDGKYCLNNILVLPETRAKLKNYVSSNITSMPDKQDIITQNAMSLFSDPKSLTNKYYELLFIGDSKNSTNYFKLAPYDGKLIPIRT